MQRGCKSREAPTFCESGYNILSTLQAWQLPINIFSIFLAPTFFTNGQLKEQYQQRGAFLGVETQHLIYGDNGAAAEVDKK